MGGVVLAMAGAWMVGGACLLIDVLARVLGR